MTSDGRSREASGDSHAKKARPLYVLLEFPRISETFILDQVSELTRTGMDVKLVCCARSGAEHSTAKAKELLKRTAFLPDRPAQIRNALAFSVAHPFAAMSSLAHCVRLGRVRDWVKGVGAYLVATKEWKGGFTHVHTHFAHEAVAIAAATARLLGVPYTFTGHAVDIFVRPRSLCRKLSGARALIATCRYNIRYLTEACPDVPEEKYTVIHSALDLSLFDFRPRIERNAERPRLLSVGRLVEKKGFPRLLEAVSLLSRSGRNVDLDIVGGGPLEGELRETATGLGIEDRVTFHGALPRDEVLKLYDRTDVFVLPCVISQSGDRDTMPNVIKEAMAQGIPVVTTPIAAIPELVGEDCAFLAKPGDSSDLAATIAMAADAPEDELREMLVRARRRIEEAFDVRKEAQKLAGVFERVASGRQP